MEAFLDTHLRVRRADIPAKAWPLIKSALTYLNPEREAARKEMLYGWEDLPTHVYFWTEHQDQILMPRGFAHSFAQGMKDLGVPVEFIDERVLPESDWAEGIEPIKLRDHQVPAVGMLLKSEQGIYEAPPASGKTVTILEVARRVSTPTLIITHKKEIADQWRKRAQQFLGYTPALIGDGEFEEGDFTIALQQTLWSQRERLDEEGWWAKWGFVCLDECHHVPADTFQEIFQRFPARYRLGVSGTPDKGQDIPISKIYIGRVVHKTEKKHLVGSVIMKPKVRVVQTDFDFDYRPTRRYKGRVIRNNYQKLVTAMIEDGERNSLIAQTILSQRGHHNLVLSNRLKHLDTLRGLVVAYGWPEESVFMLRGKEDMAERAEVVEQIHQLGESVVFSTLADEALDIPPLDRLHMAFPAREPDLYKQRIGRIERIYEGKEDAIVFDYVDFQVGVIKSQFRTRRVHVYNKEQLHVSGAV